MVFNYQKVLLIGATSGIGEALAHKLVNNNSFVIIAGRREDKLRAFVQKYGNQRTAALVLDVTKFDQIAAFCTEVKNSHPDIDCVFLNSGIQRPFDLTKPTIIRLDTLEEELTTNYLSAVHLTVGLLPILQARSEGSRIIYTSSQMGLVPMVRCPNYGASKAALHHFILALREQMKDGPGNVRITEIYPPAVQTELHDAKHQPDLKNGHQIGMPLVEFVDAVWSGLEKDNEQITVGTAKYIYDAFESKRQEAFKQMNTELGFLLKQFVVE